MPSLYIILTVVSIHAPTEGATRNEIAQRVSAEFQSTLPRRERRLLCQAQKAVRRFNPRSHGGSDGDLKAFKRSTKVSIHAPTEGATAALILFLETLQFQSTLPRRERQHRQGHENLNLCFNPRSHGGSDIDRLPCRGRRPVSIHAPTEGATARSADAGRLKEFQSTLPRRERPAARRIFRRGLGCFNPRSHGGSDESQTKISLAVNVSIHAPTEGATSWPNNDRLFLLSFNPRSHGGSDSFSTSCHSTLKSFNPRSHGGSDCSRPSTLSKGLCFNPRSHGGSDVVRWEEAARCALFQSTLPRRERPGDGR